MAFGRAVGETSGLAFPALMKIEGEAVSISLRVFLSPLVGIESWYEQHSPRSTTLTLLGRTGVRVYRVCTELSDGTMAVRALTY